MHAEAYYTIIPQIESEVSAVVVHTTHESAACTVLFHMRLLIGRYTPKCKDTSPKEVYPHSQCYQCTCRVCHCGQEQEERGKEEERRWFHCYKQYAMPIRKMGKVTDKGGGVVGSGGVEEGEQYDNTVRPTYEPKAESESAQQSEGGSN